MDLMIAIMQRATVLDVRSRTIDCGRRQRSDWQCSIFQSIQEGAAGLAKCSPEGWRDGGEVGLLRNLDTRLPGLEAIDISRFDRTLRMEATRFTAVFDVDAEDNPFRLSRSTAMNVVSRRDLANTREDDRIGWGRTRLWPLPGR